MITHKTEVTNTRQVSGETVFTVIVDKDAAPEAPIILDEVRIVDPELSLLWELGFDRTTDELRWRHYFDAVKPLSAAIEYVGDVKKFRVTIKEMLSDIEHKTIMDITMDTLLMAVEVALREIIHQINLQHRQALTMPEVMLKRLEAFDGK